MSNLPMNSEEVISELETVREKLVEVSLYKQAKAVDIAIMKLKSFDKLYEEIRENNTIVTKIVKDGMQKRFVCNDCKGKNGIPMLWILCRKSKEAILVDVDLMWDGNNELVCKKCGRKINID